MKLNAVEMEVGDMLSATQAFEKANSIQNEVHYKQLLSCENFIEEACSRGETACTVFSKIPFSPPVLGMLLELDYVIKGEGGGGQRDEGYWITISWAQK
jgi:hypothetical protein